MVTNRPLLIGIIDNMKLNFGSRKSQLENLMHFFRQRGIEFQIFTLLPGKKHLQANVASIEKCDGLILTGSLYNISQIDDPTSQTVKDLITSKGNLLNYEVDLVRKFSKPILGICFGHQLLGYAFQNKIVRIPEKHQRNVEKSGVFKESKLLLFQSNLVFGYFPPREKKYMMSMCLIKMKLRRLGLMKKHIVIKFDQYLS